MMEQVKRPDLESAIKDYSPCGLTSLEARARLIRHGENNFSKEKLTGWKVFLGQFVNPMSFILILHHFFPFLWVNILMGQLSW